MRLVSKTLEGRIQSWNAGAERDIGERRRNQSVSRHLIIPPDLRDEEAAI